MRSIRKRRGNIETAVVRYTSPVRKPITVIGMQHIADASFYDTVAEEIKALQGEGAVVHYELTGPGSDEELEQLPRELVGLVRELRENGERRRAEGAAKLSDLLGLASQHRLYDQYADTEGWENHDFTDAQMASYFGVRSMRKMMESSTSMMKMLDQDDERVRRWSAKIMLFLIRHINVLYPLTNLVTSLRPRKAAEQAIILDMRNSVAVNAALKAAEERPVVMPWGAGHIPGLTDKLAEYHYRVDEVRWLTALRRPA